MKAVVLIRHTITIRHRESCLKIPLPRMPGYRLCPVQAIYRVFSLDLASSGGRSGVCNTSEKLLQTFNTCIVCDTLTAVIASVWWNSSVYAGHSLRRGGATWAYNAGVPFDTIRILGDWKLNAYTVYIEPNLAVIKESIKHMITAIPQLN